MCSACLLHPMSVNQLHSTKLVVRVFGVSGTRVRLILEYDSTCVYILDMQLHQQPYKHFFLSHCHHQVHCVAQTVTADQPLSTTIDQLPNFNPCATID